MKRERVALRIQHEALIAYTYFVFWKKKHEYCSNLYTCFNLTLKIVENSVIDLELEFGGICHLANTPDKATHPEKFPSVEVQL